MNTNKRKVKKMDTTTEKDLTILEREAIECHMPAQHKQWYKTLIIDGFLTYKFAKDEILTGTDGRLKGDYYYPTLTAKGEYYQIDINRLPAIKTEVK